jgi:hypothetical protein
LKRLSREEKGKKDVLANSSLPTVEPSSLSGYNRSKGSILVAGIAHAAANTAFAFLPGVEWLLVAIVNSVAALALVMIDRMWKKFPADHPAVHGLTQLAGKPDVEPTPASL